MCYYEGILGLKRGYDGLHIEPCFPKKWEKVSATRYYRGNLLEIEYERGNDGKITLEVDGKAIEGNVVPLFKDNENHSVKVKF